jgi:putative hydrolase of the HAD superfamily
VSSEGRGLDGLVVALDVDGVLLDSERGGAGSWQHAVADRFGVDPSELQRTFFDQSWSEVIVGRRSIEDALGSVIAQNSWPVSVDEFLDCWLEADFWPVAGVVSAAESWSQRGARLALVTNQEHRRAAYVRERLGDLLPIERMVYSAEVGHVKTEPEFFVEATRLLARSDSASTIVFVDDTPIHVEIARRSGWTAVVYEAHAWPEQMEVALGAAAARRRRPMIRRSSRCLR